MTELFKPLRELDESILELLDVLGDRPLPALVSRLATYIASSRPEGGAAVPPRPAADAGDAHDEDDESDEEEGDDEDEEEYEDDYARAEQLTPRRDEALLDYAEELLYAAGAQKVTQEENSRSAMAGYGGISSSYHAYFAADPAAATKQVDELMLQDLAELRAALDALEASA